MRADCRDREAQMGLNLTQKVLKEHLVEGELVAGEEIAIALGRTGAERIEASRIEASGRAVVETLTVAKRRQ